MSVHQMSVAEECIRAAERCEEAAIMLRRMAEGDSAAAATLDALCNVLPYDGCVLYVRVSRLLAAFEDES